ncbi:ABC transporter substrate-binding protein [Rubrobacter taiwanensis]|jgi:iron complex transport system substrate-binding protein|uniref:ABC transporter substrate-binding protein n=1 Tax=Rubrobacter taiwanensis TaxID=185139 RepID=A0A4R1B7L7_9ACTN|nr:ABC transporter substrate-binding protein [Rubrobacter taiwanensis]TCJ13067.1 ABC transporter substrate-binding protein [Rubrobacter taiwanensis]
MTKEAAERVRTLPPLPEIDDATRREFLIGAAGLLLLPAGCGSDGERGGSEPSGETRTFEHAFGEIEIPVSPKRVAVLTAHALDAVVALGIEPVAGVTGYSELYAGALEDAEVKFPNQEPNLEALARVEPDLMLTLGFEGELFFGDYEKLSEIAPTAVFDWTSDGEWKPHFRFCADALGRLEEAEVLISELLRRRPGPPGRGGGPDLGLRGAGGPVAGRPAAIPGGDRGRRVAGEF